MHRASLPRAFTGLACAVLLAAAACSDDDDDTGSSSDASTADGGGDAGFDAGGRSGPLEVATFNAGLLDAVGYVAQRAPRVNEALADLDVDLLCVQEVWDQDHWDALAAANEGERPHVLRPDPKPGVPGVCSPDEFDPALACAEDKCADPGPMGLAACTTTNCLAQVLLLSTPCVTCLLENAPSNDFDLIEATCRGDGSEPATPPEGPEGRSYVQGGSYGIGLLSRFPLDDTDVLELDASTTRRAVLYARVDAPGVGPLSVFCTHLTPDLIGSAYDGSYGSWAEENAAHVQALIEWVDDKTDDGAPVLVLGDLNTGPAGDGIEAELPDSYAALPTAGFDDPFVTGPDAACTFCADNDLVRALDTGVDAILDHVLVRDVDATVTTRRIFTEAFDVDDDAGEDGGAPSGPATLPLSDHYGIAATLEP